MYNAKYIIPGLIVFVALVLFPFFYNKSGPFEVKVELPPDMKECIEPVEVMRARHMQILDEWRDLVVRQNKRVYTNSKGKQFDMSLTNGCIECHAEKEKFCDRCHTPVGVNPYCWDCHNISPKQKTAIPPSAASTAQASGH